METYHDDTILQKGRFKRWKLNQVPIRYLINLYKSPESFDLNLIRFVKNNIVRILQAKEEKLSTLPILNKHLSDYETCKKIKYPTKKEARYVLKHIRERENDLDHKKPIRSYECEYCSMWHHTSMPIEEWKEIKKLKKTSP